MNIVVKKRTTDTKKVMCNIMVIIAMLVLIVPCVTVNAASTKVSASIINGRWNPFKSDGGKGTLTYCTDHKYPDADFCYSKCTMTLQVGSNKTKTVKELTYATGVNSSYMIPTYCDKNSGSKSITLDSPSGDSAKVKARVKTQDCFCGQCVFDGEDDAEDYCFYTSSWKSE